MTPSYDDKLAMNETILDKGYVHLRGFIFGAFLVIYMALCLQLCILPYKEFRGIRH